MLIASSSAVPVARDGVCVEGGQSLPQWTSDLGGSRRGVPATSSDSENTKRGNAGLDPPFSQFVSVSSDDPRTEANRRAWHARWDRFRVFDPDKASHNPTAEQSRACQRQFGQPRRGRGVSQGSLCQDEGKGRKERRDSPDASDESQFRPPAPAPADKGCKNDRLTLDEDKGKGRHAGRDSWGESNDSDDAHFRPPLPDKGKGHQQGRDSSCQLGQRQGSQEST